MATEIPALKVVNPGLQCLIQDKGRFGVGATGLSQGELQMNTPVTGQITC